MENKNKTVNRVNDKHLSPIGNDVCFNVLLLVLCLRLSYLLLKYVTRLVYSSCFAPEVLEKLSLVYSVPHKIIQENYGISLLMPRSLSQANQQQESDLFSRAQPSNYFIYLQVLVFLLLSSSNYLCSPPPAKRSYKLTGRVDFALLSLPTDNNWRQLDRQSDR